MAASPAVVEIAEKVGLHYVTDSSPGISRRKSGGGFAYYRPNGSLTRNPETLDRIRKLAIPPAYRNVWICSDPDGHLQATGIDARGRKQYRYHPRFREVREESKFHHMLEFGRALPRIRERVAQDVALRNLSRDKVLAVVVSLLERSLIRVGNEEYVRQNKSYGLTTMLSRQTQIKGETIEFSFLGKSKTRHRIEVHDHRLARAVKRIQDLPGQELLHYLDTDGTSRCVSSSDVNSYLKEITGEHFTAKDFRTWWGTLLAFVELANRETPPTKMGTNRVISEAMKNVAKQLGNTPAICRKCYVHPFVVESFRSSALGKVNLVEDALQDGWLPTVERQLAKLLRAAG